MSVFKMSKTLLKNIFHGPYTVPYPVKKKETYDGPEGKLEFPLMTAFSAVCVKEDVQPGRFRQIRQRRHGALNG